MNAATIGSLAGPLAIIFSLSIPILSIVAILVIILVVARNRHRERMKMIEQGMVPPATGRTGNFYPLLIIGAISFSFGLGLFITELLSSKPDLEAGLILGLTGLAMLISFVIIRRLNRNRRQIEQEPRPKEPLSS